MQFCPFLAGLVCLKEKGRVAGKNGAHSKKIAEQEARSHRAGHIRKVGCLNFKKMKAFRGAGLQQKPAGLAFVNQCKTWWGKQPAATEI